MTNIQAELIKALRDCAATWNTIDDCDVEECPFTSYGSMCIDTMLEAAADAIERLTAEVDRKDKAIQGLLTQIEKLNESEHENG